MTTVGPLDLGVVLSFDFVRRDVVTWRDRRNQFFDILLRVDRLGCQQMDFSKICEPLACHRWKKQCYQGRFAEPEGSIHVLPSSKRYPERRGGSTQIVPLGVWEPSNAINGSVSGVCIDPPCAAPAVRNRFGRMESMGAKQRVSRNWNDSCGLPTCYHQKSSGLLCAVPLRKPSCDGGFESLVNLEVLPSRSVSGWLCSTDGSSADIFSIFANIPLGVGPI